MMARLSPLPVPRTLTPASGESAPDFCGGCRLRFSPRLASGFVLVLLLLLGLTSRPAVAQMGPTGSMADTIRITFDEAIGIALDQNTTLKRAANQVRSSEASLRAERFDWTPGLNLSSSLFRNFGRSFSQEEGGIVNESTDFFSVNAGSSISFQGLGVQNWTSMRSAELNATASELGLQRTRQDVVFQVMNGYIALVENREILVVQREELQARQQQLRQIEEFVDAGSRPISALYEQQAAVAEAESSVLTAERDVQLAETRLLQTLRLDPMQPYAFEAPTLEEDVEPESQYDLQRLMREAFDRRLDLRADRTDVQAASRSVRSARSQYLPTVTVSADYGTNWSSGSELPIEGSGQDPTVVQIPTTGGSAVPYAVPGTGAPRQFFQPAFMDQLDNRRGGSFGLSLRFPIFDGLRREQQIEQAQVRELNAQYALEDQKLQVALEVREAYLNYQTAVKQLDVTAKQVRAARQARDAAQERYNLGAASIVELTNANRNFVQAASQRIRARYNFLFQQKLIAYHVGTLNPRESLFQP